MTPHLHLLGPTPGLFAAPAGWERGAAPRAPESEAGTSPHALPPTPPSPLLPPGKPFAALCLVALEKGGVTRDELVDYLWPDAPPERARASVRQALHVVRKALGSPDAAPRPGPRPAPRATSPSDATAPSPSPSPLLDDGGRLTLAPGALHTDLDDLAAHLTAHDLEAAHALWRGGPFAHFSLADAPAFNDWADRLRSRWERRLGEALSDRGAAEREAGRDEEALAWLGRALDVRPFDEHAHAGRVEMLVELALLDEAEGALDQARSVVDDPTPGVFDELEGRLRAARRAALSGAENGDGDAYPVLSFVGRTAEMAELRALWRSALSGRPRSVAVLGEAGIGKSRLAEEFVRHTVGPDATVVRVKALDTERALALGLAAEVAKGLSSRPGAAGISNASLAALRQLVPHLGNGSGPAPIPGALSEVAVAEALLDLTEAVGHEAPLVLWVEDLQWADAPSRAVLLRLARSLRGVQVLCIFTCRSGDADLSAVRTLRAEADGGRMALLPLAPLSAGEVHEALALSLVVRPADAAQRLAARLTRATRGNPLFLAELLLRLHADGHLAAEAGHWVVDAASVGDDLPLPSTVREILEARLRDVASEYHPLLAGLAHAPRPPSVEGMARRITAPPEAVEARVSALAAQGILERVVDAEGTARVAFAHDSLRAAAREIFPTPARPPARGRVWRRWALGAAAVAAALLAYPSLQAPAPPPEPLYPGVLWVAEPGWMRLYRTPSIQGGAWDTLPSIPIPPELTWPQLALTAEGTLALFGDAVSELGVPNAARVTAEGTVERLLESPWDLNFSGLSPGGRYALLHVADESSGEYRTAPVRYDLATGDTVHLYSAAEQAGGRWFGDGASVGITVSGTPDTLVLARPDGVELGRRPRAAGEEDTGPSVCGAPGAERLELRWVEGTLRVFTGPWIGDGEAERWRVSVPLTTYLFCSPDGRAAMAAARVAGQLRLLVVGLASGDTLLGPPVRDIISFGWVPHRLPAVPVEVAVEEPSLVLGWGESRRLGARVRRADGSDGSGVPVAWASLDPAVASVREGVVYANGVGTTALVASVQGWIHDTVRVRVAGASLAGEALLADPFQRFDTTVWAAYGSPHPEAVEAEDGPALDLRGDGVGADGIASRRLFDLSRGATLEFSYRLPLTRRDRQSIVACLSAGPTPLETGRPPGGAQGTHEACFGHPAGEQAQFHPSSFVFWSPGTRGPILRSPHLPSDGWVRVAIVLAPDGNGRLFLNQEEVARLPWPLHNGPEVRWHLRLEGRAADTRLLVRDLMLWEGMRY